MKIERAAAFVEKVERSRPGFVVVTATHSASVHSIEVECRDDQQPKIGDRLWVSVTLDER